MTSGEPSPWQQAEQIVETEKAVKTVKRARKKIWVLLLWSIFLWPGAYVYIWGWLKGILAFLSWMLLTAIIQDLDRMLWVFMGYQGIGFLVGLFSILLARAEIKDRLKPP